MFGAAVALAVLAFVLAWPVPLLLGRASWPSRSPAVALILWQAIALAGGLSMLGALVTFGLDPFGDDLISASRAFVDYLFGSPAIVPRPWHLLALSGALLLGGHLVANLILTIARSELQRRRHAHLIELLSTPIADMPDARLIDSPAPVAYCLPGALGSVTVFSAGLLELLDPAELSAVIEHEKAHVSQRHDVVLVAFRAWHSSLPWFPIAFRAEREVALLIEMLADDRARRVVSAPVLARAIALVGSGSALTGASPAALPANPASPADVASLPPIDTTSPHALRDRVLRLADRRPLPTAAEALIVGASAALIGVPTVLLFAPALLALVG